MSDPEKKTVNSPPQFTDSEGSNWSIKLTIGLTDRILEEAQLDLIPDDMDVQPIMGLLFQNRKLTKILWLCIERQAELNDVDQEAFKARCDAETLTNGWGALVDAVIFFIRQKNETLGEAIAETIEAQMQLIGAGANQLLATLKNPETKKTLQRSADSLGKQMRDEMNKLAKDPLRPIKASANSLSS